MVSSSCSRSLDSLVCMEWFVVLVVLLGERLSCTVYICITLVVGLS